MNTLSEIEVYYKKRERRLIEKLHKQEAALAAANQKLKQLTENQRATVDETAEQHAAREQKLKEELYRDPLTGAYNRRYYEEVVRKTIGPAGVALLDVDDFKICNDTYGHHAGDMALKTAANAIQSRIRKSDLRGRVFDSWCHSLGYCHGYRNCCSCRLFLFLVLQTTLSGW